MNCLGHAICNYILLLSCFDVLMLSSVEVQMDKTDFTTKWTELNWNQSLKTIMCLDYLSILDNLLNYSEKKMCNPGEVCSVLGGAGSTAVRHWCYHWGMLMFEIHIYTEVALNTNPHFLWLCTFIMMQLHLNYSNCYCHFLLLPSPSRTQSGLESLLS